MHGRTTRCRSIERAAIRLRCVGTAGTKVDLSRNHGTRHGSP
jgi:hypothetical protein